TNHEGLDRPRHRRRLCRGRHRRRRRRRPAGLLLELGLLPAHHAAQQREMGLGRLPPELREPEHAMHLHHQVLFRRPGRGPHPGRAAVRRPHRRVLVRLLRGPHQELLPGREHGLHPPRVREMALRGVLDPERAAELPEQRAGLPDLPRADPGQHPVRPGDGSLVRVL
ncbi:hypothetical protein DFJ74DRAFT_655730, partial [Hyaloraphidium curvatum]